MRLGPVSDNGWNLNEEWRVDTNTFGLLRQTHCIIYSGPTRKPVENTSQETWIALYPKHSARYDISKAVATAFRFQRIFFFFFFLSSFGECYWTSPINQTGVQHDQRYSVTFAKHSTRRQHCTTLCLTKLYLSMWTRPDTYRPSFWPVNDIVTKWASLWYPCSEMIQWGVGSTCMTKAPNMSRQTTTGLPGIPYGWDALLDCNKYSNYMHSWCIRQRHRGYHKTGFLWGKKKKKWMKQS